MKINEIPAKIDKNTGEFLTVVKKKRVAGYARVSTDLLEQKNSYETQLKYYTEYISSNPNWDFVKLYSDEGITGTKVLLRTGFKNMINDATDGKIDIIVTKSISRFARNTVDSLKTIRMLKKCGVDVYFEKENFHTLTAESELLLGIISGISQEESHSISENTKWGIRKRFMDGIPRRPYKKVLGYVKKSDNKIIVNQSEKEIVLKIFNLYIDGYSPSTIAKKLLSEHINNATGVCKWSSSSIITILKNELYTGDTILQKYYNKDFLSKKKIINDGKLQKFILKNEHEAIIKKEIFNYVAFELEKRKRNIHISRKTILASKVYCGECEKPLRRKCWGKKDKKRYLFICSANRNNKCFYNYIYESELKAKIVIALNYLILHKKENIISNFVINKYETLKTKMFNENLKAQNTILHNYDETICARFVECVKLYRNKCDILFKSGRIYTFKRKNVFHKKFTNIT